MTISITILKAGRSAYTTLRLCLLAVILSAFMLSVVMVNVTFSYCYSKCRGVGWKGWTVTNTLAYWAHS
jgi:hypothetical protein